MSCSRTSDPRFYLALISLLALCACRDEVERPYDPSGHLEVRLRSSLAQGFSGSRLTLDGAVMTAGSADSVYRFTLSPGRHEIALERDCSTITPPSPQVRVLKAGDESTLVFQVEPLNGALEITSSIPGAEIFLDGIDQGKKTPNTLACLDPGDHQVAVSLLGARASADSARTITVTGENQSLHFELVPRDQARRCVLELFSATLCQYCPIADAAAESLRNQAERTARGLITLQIHPAFGPQSDPSDPFYNQAGTQRRIDLYGVNALPVAFFDGNGPWPLPPSHPTVPGAITLYEGHVNEILSGENGRVSIYWMRAEPPDNHRIGGTVRVMLLQDLAPAESLKLWVLDYKDRLPAIGPDDQEAIFNNVVREFKWYGNLNRDLALHERGDYADVDVAFDLSADVRWSEARMGLVAYVQNPSDRRIEQVSQKMLYPQP